MKLNSIEEEIDNKSNVIKEDFKKDLQERKLKFN